MSHASLPCWRSFWLYGLCWGPRCRCYHHGQLTTRFVSQRGGLPKQTPHRRDPRDKKINVHGWSLHKAERHRPHEPIRKLGSHTQTHTDSTCNNWPFVEFQTLRRQFETAVMTERSQRSHATMVTTNLVDLSSPVTTAFLWTQHICLYRY